jgi:Tfp pilus assembly protein PilE
MGQQQLLLVILVTIIVGIATVVAINTFGSAADSANIDAVRQDVATIAASAQGYYMKPAMLGGGGRTFDAGDSDDDNTGITFNDIAFASNGIDADGLQAWNENGVYVISARGENAFTITAHPASRMTNAPDADETATDPLVATVGPDALTWTQSN